MKKITFLFLLSSILFSSCETDFTVNADWKEVTVVYGLLDQSQEKQYIRINKAFLGNENAYVMASVADSINYNPNNLEVKIEKLSASGNVLATKILTDTIMFKEDGLFSVEENIIYVFDTDNFLNEEKEYKLTITNLVSGNIISSQTKLIHNLSLMSAFNNSAYKMGFYSQSGDFSNTTIEWTHSKNARIHGMSYSQLMGKIHSNGIELNRKVLADLACVDYGKEDIVFTTKISGTPCTVINTPYVQQTGTTQNWIEKILSKNKKLKRWVKMITYFKGMKGLENAAFSSTYKTVWCAGPSIEHTNEILPIKKIVEKFISL